MELLPGAPDEECVAWVVSVSFPWMCRKKRGKEGMQPTRMVPQYSIILGGWVLGRWGMGWDGMGEGEEGDVRPDADFGDEPG